MSNEQYMPASSDANNQNYQSAHSAGRATKDYALSCQNLTKIYGSGPQAVTAVDQVSVSFERGTFTAILGPSGSGKSTFMHCMAGLDRITSGQSWIGQNQLTGLTEKQLTTIRRNKVGFIFQAFNLLPTLTARQNILLPLDLMGKKPDKARFSQLINTLHIADRLDHRPSELSGGQKQRVAIARAMISQPEVIFADEPTGALDSKTGVQLLEYLRSCSRDFGQTIVMVTHDLKAASYASRALVLFDGRIANDISNPDTNLLLAALNSLEN